MRVQLHTCSGTPIGDELAGALPWCDYLTWNGRFFRRASEEQPTHLVQHFHEVGFIALTSGGHWDKTETRFVS